MSGHQKDHPAENTSADNANTSGAQEHHQPDTPDGARTPDAASDVERLLNMIDRPGRIAIGISDPTTGVFRREVVDTSEVPNLIKELNDGTRNLYLGIGRLGTTLTSSGGSSKDVRAIGSLPIDIDVKPEGMPSWDAARAVVDALSNALQADFAAVINTGHGLQPWPITDPDDDQWINTGTKDPHYLNIQAALRRFQRLVNRFAAIHGGAADNVSDLARVLRAPGTLNVKDPNNPIPVTVERWGTGTPITMQRLLETFDEYDIPELPEDRELIGDIQSAHGDWEWADTTCNYVTAMINGWETDQPHARHPWLVNQATRLAAAHRNGCITQNDHQDAINTLTGTFQRLLTTGQPRTPGRNEINDALAWGITRVETKTSEDTEKELAHHIHNGNDPFLKDFPGYDDTMKRAADNAVEQSTDTNPTTRDQAENHPTPDITFSSPSAYVGSEGLKVHNLAHDILKHVSLRSDTGDMLWLYRDGVWKPDHTNLIRTLTTHALANRFRNTHLSNVTTYLLGQVPRINPQPLPHIINTRNGHLDWETGILNPHDPEAQSTVQLSATWHPQATCPVVEQWLSQVLPADLLEPQTDSPGFIWEVIGYLCMSGNPLHKAILLLGSGRNGKGTFLRLITALLGHDNISSVDLHALTTNRFRSAELFGKVANIAGDIESAYLESTALFKAITGGDRIQAERKYGKAFDFTPFAVPVFSANAVFGTSDTTTGYMSRWIVIPFPNEFHGHEDRNLDAILQQQDQIDGVLVKAVEGLRALMARGNFTTPPSLAEAFDRFADESDPVRAFMRDITRPAPDVFVPRDQVWRLYEVWARENGQRNKLSRQGLYSRLESAGWTPKKSQGLRGFAGRDLTMKVADGHFPGEAYLEAIAGGSE